MFRDHFPLLAKEGASIYLDSAATTQKPKEVVEAMSSFLLEECGTVHRAIYSLAAGATSRYNAVRDLVREFLSAEDSSEIVFTKGTTEGINLVASSFGKAFIQPGDEIFLSETEHHSNIVPWQMMAEERGAHIRVIPVDDQGDISLEFLQKNLSSKAKIVSIAYIANATGAVHPIKEVIELAHAFGAKVLIDAAQAVSHLPIDVRDLDADFLVFSGHKAYGPTGIGVLYGKRALLEAMPPYQGGGDMIQAVSFEKTTYQEPPLRFEAGTPPIAEVIGLGAAIEFIQKIGFEAIARHEKQLTEKALLALSKIPEVKLLSNPKHRASLIALTCQERHPLDVGTLLDARGFAVRTGHLCAQPTLKRFGVTSVIRISFGIYNTLSEIEKFSIALQEVLAILA
jgi:cysteine desulfurase/selenocysteine lyase